MGDDHYSTTAGSSYTFRFTGSRVALYGAKASHHGQATVQIDGGSATTVDQYSSTRQENVLMYQSPALADGEHVVKVTVKGSRSAAATGYVVSVDRAVVTR
jgi:mannan endo-1,4-beta-mannosidase